MASATQVAGWLAIGIGVGHSVLAPPMRRREWSEIRRRPPWRSIKLEPRPGEVARAEAFWFGPGSFGVPWTLFGALVVATDRRGGTVPRALGVATTAWGAAMTALLPASPTWSMPVVGALLLTGARGPRGGDAPAPRGRDAGSRGRDSAHA